MALCGSRLIESGTLEEGMSTPAPDRQTRGLIFPKNAPPYFHALIKPTGAICNLDCKYCFFLSKELLYPGSRFQMAEELLETYRLFSASD
jgi:hypothetical protein